MSKSGYVKKPGMSKIWVYQKSGYVSSILVTVYPETIRQYSGDFCCTIQNSNVDAKSELPPRSHAHAKMSQTKGCPPYYEQPMETLTVFPLIVRGFPSVFLWFSVVWFSLGFPLVPLGLPSVFPWFSLAFPQLSFGFSQFSQVVLLFSLRLPWFSAGSPFGFP